MSEQKVTYSGGKSKPPKFFIREQDGREYIVFWSRRIHILAVVEHYATQDELREAMIDIAIGSSRDTYICRAIDVVSLDSDLSGQKLADKVAGYMRRMAEWYKYRAE